MSPTATTTAAAKTANIPDAKAVDMEWRACPLSVPNLNDMEREDILDVVKMALRPRPVLIQKPGLPDALKVVRDALTEDPFNMILINELGRLYASHARWACCSNVLLRGWKRAKEISDAHIRFRFLMKLSEASFRQSKFKQAFAVLMDVQEPTGEDLKCYLLFACQVSANVGDTQRALKFFQKAIDGESFQRAVRVLALTMFDLQKANAFESAKGALAKMGNNSAFDESSLEMLHTIVNKSSTRKTPVQWDKIFIGVVVAIFVMLVIYGLWLLEQRSLQGLKSLKDLKK